MEYLDFFVRVSDSNGPAYAVSVDRSPAGAASGALHLQIDPAELSDRLDPFGTVRSSREETRSFSPAESTGPTARDTGRLLFEALLDGEILAAYRTSLRHARSVGHGLRLRLRLDAPGLAILPWELMFDPEVGDFVGLSSVTPVVREVDVGWSRDALRVERPLRVLAMVSAPSDAPALDTAAERARILEATASVRAAGLLDVTWLDGATWRDLQSALQQGPYHAFHFIGHADFDRERHHGVLLLEDEHRRAEAISATEVGRLLADHVALRLVVLNSCLGARQDERSPFAATSSTLVRRGIPAVIAMQYRISDRAALEFSRSFYTALAHGKPIDESVTEARKAVSLDQARSREWATPVLHLHSPDGRLFEVEPRSSPAAVPAPVDRVAPSLDGATASRRALLEDLEAETRQRLAHVPRSGAHVDVPIEVLLDAVVRRWDDELTWPVGHSSPPADWPHTAQEVFDHVFTAKRLLVLGEPGSGKTTVLTELAAALAGRAADDAAQPVPVLVSLSSWTDQRQGFDGWFIDELRRKYGMRRRFVEQLLRSRGLAVLFDGLDELPVTRQEPCVRALNDFQQTHHPPALVVCCRTEEYRLLSTKLELNAAIRLLPLADDQVRASLAGSPAKTWEALDADPELATMARTPLFLGMIAYARDALATGSKAGALPSDRVLDAYVRQLLSNEESTAPYSPAQTKRWLGALARRMRADGRDDFLIERMQPDWLDMPAALWSYRAMVAIMTGVVFAGLQTLLSGISDLMPSSRLTTIVREAVAPAWLPLDVLTLIAFSLAAGLVVAGLPAIRPIETLRWNRSTATLGLREWPRRGAVRAAKAAWPLGVGLTGVIVALVALTSAAGQLPLLGRILAAVSAVTSVAGFIVRPDARQLEGCRPRQLARPRMAMALLMALLVGASVVEPTLTSLGSTLLVAVALSWLLGASSAIDDTGARRVAGAMMIGYIAALGGVAGAVSSGATRPLPLWLWLQTAVGGAFAAGTVAVWAASPRPKLASEVSLRQSLIRWVLWGTGAGVMLAASVVAATWLGWRGAVRNAILVAGHVATTSTGALGVLGLPASIVASVAGFGGLAGVIVGLGRGITGPDVERRTLPNQGIRQSAINVAPFFVGGVLAGLPYGAFNLAYLWFLAGARPGWIEVVRYGAAGAAFVGLIAALVPGSACIQHYALRVVLWSQGRVPWRYARFLDYATDRMLLQRIGGRYRFLHVLLRDHFADLPTERS